MSDRASERPEGGRISVHAATGWLLAREIIGLLALWVVAFYVMTRRQGSVSVAAIEVAVGCLVLLLTGCGLESLVMRKSLTNTVGCLVLAAWAAWVPFAPQGPLLVAPGLLGLAIVGATPTASRTRNAERERTFLASHARWAIWRRRLRRWLTVGIAAGIGLSVLTGIWHSFSGL